MPIEAMLDRPSLPHTALTAGLPYPFEGVRHLDRWVSSDSVGARDRIVETAYDLFSRHGVRAVGVDRIVAESGVAKMSLYRHFASKDDLVLNFLQEREHRWTNECCAPRPKTAATRPQHG